MIVLVAMAKGEHGWEWFEPENAKFGKLRWRRREVAVGFKFIVSKHSNTGNDFMKTTFPFLIKVCFETEVDQYTSL